MKNFLAYSIVGLSILACSDRTPMSPTPVRPIDLGVASVYMNVVNTSGLVTSGDYNITLDVTPGAVYSLQLTHINGNILHNYPFTAQTGRVTVTLNYATVPPGAYDLYLMNTSGQELKVPVIIQR